MTDENPYKGEPMGAIPEAELKQLAMDIVDGHVVGSWQMIHRGDGDLIQAVFMPLIFMAPENVPSNLAHVCGHMSDAMGSRVINGYPMFSKIRLIPIESHARLGELIREVEAFKRQFMGTPEPSPSAPAAGAQASQPRFRIVKDGKVVHDDLTAEEMEDLMDELCPDGDDNCDYKFEEIRPDEEDAEKEAA